MARLLPLPLLLLVLASSMPKLRFILPRRPDLNARMPGYQVNMGFGLHVGEWELPYARLSSRID